MSYTKDHTQESIKIRGEVFTPEVLVEEMLAKLPPIFFTSAEKTMLDNSCGSGNFLVKILHLRMKNGVNHVDALSTIYGVELDSNNVAECRQRLSLGETSKAVWSVLNKNIVCANALDPLHEGWDGVGYMWNEADLENRGYRKEKKRKEKKVDKKPIVVNDAINQFIE